MANMTTTGTTGYPGVLDTRTALTDGAAGDLIVANHPNGLGAAVIALETTLGVNPQGSVADVVTRLNASQNSNGTLLSTVITAGAGMTVSYSSGVFTLASSPDGPGNLQNYGIQVVPNSPVANALRVRMTDRSGSTLTSSNFAQLSFHAASSTSLLYNVVTATTDTVASLSNGSTLGFANGEKGRIYVWAINANPGAANSVIRLGLSRAAIFQEMALQTITDEGGAGAADSDNLLYAQGALSSVPVRCLGYFDITTGATAGQWTNSAEFGTLLGNGSKRTGDVVQIVTTVTGAVKTGSTQIPNDDTVPLTQEGNPWLWATITATSDVNTLVIDGEAQMASAAISRMALFVATSGSGQAIVAARSHPNASGAMDTLRVLIATPTGTTSARGYYLIGGDSGATTVTLNGEGGARLLGDKANTILRLVEVMA